MSFEAANLNRPITTSTQEEPDINIRNNNRFEYERTNSSMSQRFVNKHFKANNGPHESVSSQMVDQALKPHEIE